MGYGYGEWDLEFITCFCKLLVYVDIWLSGLAEET